MLETVIKFIIELAVDLTQLGLAAYAAHFALNVPFHQCMAGAVAISVMKSALKPWNK